MKKFITIIGVAALLIAMGISSTLEREMVTKETPHSQVVYMSCVEPQQSQSIETRIINACNDYDVNSNLAIAISKLETGNWTSDAYTQCNNVGGLLTVEGICEYESLDEGVGAFVRTLHNIGTEDIDLLAQTYCTHSPEAWAEKVRELM